MGSALWPGRSVAGADVRYAWPLVEAQPKRAEREGWPKLIALAVVESAERADSRSRRSQFPVDSGMLQLLTHHVHW